MAINRTNFNLLVDDDGTNLTGTIWDKAHIKDVILDPVDAALAWAVNGNADSGVKNNWNTSGISGNSVIEWFGPADLHLTGLAGGLLGQNVTFVNIGTKVAYFYDGHANSVAANRFRVSTTSAPVPVAPRGFISFIYDGATWVQNGHEQGAWITPPYSAADYTASAGGWTVTAGAVADCAFRLSGRTLSVRLALFGTTVTAAPVSLFRGVPGAFTAAATQYLGGGFLAQAPNLGVASVAGGGAALSWGHPSGAWPTGAVNLFGLTSFEVQ